jgi:transposase
MFWATFRYGVRSNLVQTKGDDVSARGGVTAARYLELLEEYLPRILDFDSIFMQDDAPIYKAHAVLNWFVEIGVNLADHPPYSPDLNPIENL